MAALILTLGGPIAPVEFAAPPPKRLGTTIALGDDIHIRLEAVVGETSERARGSGRRPAEPRRSDTEIDVVGGYPQPSNALRLSLPAALVLAHQDRIFVPGDMVSGDRNIRRRDHEDSGLAVPRRIVSLDEGTR